MRHFYVTRGSIPCGQIAWLLPLQWTPTITCEQPWVTIAETCELVMALLAAGDHARAVEVYSWLQQWRTSDGSYWTGYQLVEDLLWPDEKPTWTAGAILLAADALTKHTAASGLFCSVRLLDEREDSRERRIVVD